jgi:hypothetical protein
MKTPRKPKKAVSINVLLAAIRRLLVARVRRAAAGELDPADAVELDRLGRMIDFGVETAVLGMRSDGFSWQEIGNAFGITRQAAQQRWGGRGDGPGTPAHQLTDDESVSTSS